MASDRLSQTHAGDLTWHRVAIRTVGRHRVIGVCNGDDAREKRNLVAKQAVGIALPINALMVVSYNLRDLGVVVDLRKDALTDFGVFLHLSPLLEGKRTGLFQEAGREPDLADVVNKAAQVCELRFRF